MVITSAVERRIIDCLSRKKSFLLDAGAGSGKTWTLVQSLRYILNNRDAFLTAHGQKIACITYTNVAKDEIIERIEHNNDVKVSTIHDFLWDCIGQFQNELQLSLCEYLQEKLAKIEADLSKNRTGTIIHAKNTERKNKLLEELEVLLNQSISIVYRQFPKYIKGFISHDDVIALSIKLFSKYSVLRRLIVDCYPIIFIDEYQDTQESTVKILLEYLHPTNRIIIGFFGDHMQHIYDEGVGKLDSEGKLQVIQKVENYRCSKKIIHFLNTIRTDMQQFPGDDSQIDGDCRCYISQRGTDVDIDKFIFNNLQTPWQLNSVSEVKKLYLTHRFIARANGYEEIYQLYSQKAEILTKNKDNRDRCPWIDILFDVSNLMMLYSGRTQDFLQTTKYEMNSFENKHKLIATMRQLTDMKDRSTIKEIIDFVIGNGLLTESESMKNYDFDDTELKARYDALINISFRKFLTLYNVVEEDTPFSTKHGTKGSEFRHVIVIIDDDAWSNYSFNEYFSDNVTNLTRYNRTRNLFYVVSSRAKQNLAILCLSALSASAITKLHNWFGECVSYIE